MGSSEQQNAPRPYRQTDLGLRLEVRVTPKGGRDAIDGLAPDPGAADGAVLLKLRVKAAPENGKANASVLAMLSKALRHPKSALSIVRGETERRKSILISSPVSDETKGLLKALCSG
ncbi:MAG: DUF167 domain-containing protein [Rhodospirillaceae bacterium]